MPEQPDYLYDNAPLVEVIAEIRWALTPLAALPGAAFDPHFSILERNFPERAKGAGFGLIERLAPEGAPREMLGGQPLLRFRRAPREWPLYQIGPGVFTCNITPRYEGWHAFRPVLEDGIQLLLTSYPMPHEYFKLAGLQLRYIDAFTKLHGFEIPIAFLSEHLGFTITAKSGFYTILNASEHDTQVRLDIQCPTSQPPNSACELKFFSGTKAKSPALIAEIKVLSKTHPEPTLDAIMQWMDSAHSTLHNLFEFTTSEALKEKMGPRRQIEAVQ